MRTESLFSELVLRLASHPENIATEALIYILKKYASAWPPLKAWLGLAGTQLPDSLAFSTQFPDQSDNSIPDMVGVNELGEQVLIIEAKFWAELTPHQPSTYLRRLPIGKPAMVLVIAPAMRSEILWTKLVQNCSSDDVRVGEGSDVASDLRVARVGSEHMLVQTS